jgi:hypothetical protein
MLSLNIDGKEYKPDICLYLAGVVTQQFINVFVGLQRKKRA